jgi:stress response protein YsnF
MVHMPVSDTSILVHGPNGLVGSIDAAEWQQRNALERVTLTLANGQHMLLRPNQLTDRDGVAWLALAAPPAGDGHAAHVATAHTTAHDATHATVARTADARPAPPRAAVAPAAYAVDRQAPAARHDVHEVIPIVEEQAQLHKRVVTNKVRVTKTAHVKQAVADEPLRRETVDVERVAVNRVIDAPVEIRHEGDTVIVPVMEEVLVVEKRLVLREEVRLTTRRTEHRQPQTVDLRYEQVSVERVPATDAAASNSASNATGRAAGHAAAQTTGTRVGNAVRPT